jgi:fatty-acyl-CoA synthase
MSTGLYDGCSMGELLVRAIQRGGDRDAFILDDRRITYRAFGALLSRFIQALEARGLRKGDAVATLSANRPEAFLTTAAAYLM